MTDTDNQNDFTPDAPVPANSEQTPQAQSPAHQLATQQLHDLRANLKRIVIGQEAVIDQVIVALLCDSHVLLEGLPGLGKTLLVRALATSFSGRFKRIQFTPDLMPADVTGHAIYDMNTGKFHLRKGPIFTNILLADEINRSPAKTQASLLEVMQEKQATIEGESMTVPSPFLVLATQNPIEQEGTYPLPEAELDRFLLKVIIDYPNFEDEVEVVKQVTTGALSNDSLSSLVSNQLSSDDILAMQQCANDVEVDEQVIQYAVRIVGATRESTALIKGASPRASIGLIKAAKAWALLQGRSFVLPDDIKAIAAPILRHRILLTPDMEIDNFTTDQVIEQLLQSLDAPRS